MTKNNTNQIPEIRSKLKTGYSIEKICQEYHITFDELVKLMQTSPSNNTKQQKSDSTTGHLYISRRYGLYLLRKSNAYYGSYRTLTDAIKIRDYFMSTRWDKRNIDKACQKLGVQRIKKEKEE